MDSKRRQTIQALASAAALAAVSTARAVGAPASPLPHRHVMGLGTAGSALVTAGERLGVFGARDFVRIMDRDHGADWPFECSTLRYPAYANVAPHETLIVACLGGRGGRMSGVFAKDDATYWPASRRTAIFIIPHEFEHPRFACARSQLPVLTDAFHCVTVLRNEVATLEPGEPLSTAHERTNSAVFVALRRF